MTAAAALAAGTALLTLLLIAVAVGGSAAYRRHSARIDAELDEDLAAAHTRTAAARETDSGYADPQRGGKPIR